MLALGCSSSSDDSAAGSETSSSDGGSEDSGNTVTSDDGATKPEADSGNTDGSTTHEGGVIDVDAGPYPYGAYGSYKPGPTTSGAKACGTLTPYTNQFGAIVDGVLTLSTPNTTISGYDIPAFIVSKADKITIENCCVHGPAVLPADGSRNMINAYETQSTNLVVRDCTLFASVPDHNSEGMQGKSFLAARNNIYNVVDGIDPLGDGSTILANYIHDLAWFSPDSNHSDNHSHNDCVQLEGGSATAMYNNLEGFLSPTAGDGAARPYDQTNSAMLMSAMTAVATTNLVISHNWIDGGQVAVNVGPGTYTNLGTVTDNIFGDNQYYDGVTVLLNATRASIGLTLSGNVYNAVDKPLHTPSRAGTIVDTGNGVSGG